MKPHFRIFNVCLALFCTFTIQCNAQSSDFCVVIDAGHGGKDPGTVWDKNYEKDINLSIAKLTGKFIEEQLAGVEIKYTRADDRFLTLSERTDVANKANATIFISIHTNSSPNRSATGTETYVMGVDKSKANLEVAMRENGVISLESDYSERYEGYDPQSSESLIMFSLMQYSYLGESISLAKKVQDNYKGSGMVDRGVKQASFLVLWRTSMPSILTEVGYLSNADNAKYILSSDGQKKIAQSIADAAVSYLKDGEDNIVVKRVEAQKVVAQKVVPAQKVQVEVGGENILFGVQIKASRSKMSINSTNFGPYVMSIVELFDGKLYKYVVKGCNNYKEVVLLQSKLRENYGDAFVVAFDKAQNIVPLDKARKLTEL